MTPDGLQTLSVLIPDGDTWDTVKVLRCLGPALRSYVLSEQRAPLSKFSRFCRGHYSHKNGEEWLSNIQDLTLKLKIDVLFPVLEKAIELVIRHRSELSDIVAIPHLPSINAFHIVRDKWSFYNFCLQNNLPVPPSILLDDNLESTYDKINVVQLPSPVLLKPINATGGGRGITIIRSDAEKSATLKSAYQTGKQYILQSYIPGDDLCLSGYCRRGEIQKYTIQKSLFSRDNYFGPQRAMDFIDDARVVELCARLTAVLKWEGLICIDLRVDSRDQSIKFLEVNPRLGQAVLGSFSAGINFPTLACLDAKGVQPPDMLYTPTRYYHPRASWKMLLPGKNRTRHIGRSHSGLHYTLNDPLPELMDLAKRLCSLVGANPDRQTTEYPLSSPARGAGGPPIKCESLLAAGVTARMATEQDLDFLINLCRRCLPDQRFWQGPRVRAQKWWRSLIRTDFSELWIFVYRGARIGFCKLDKDTERFEAHKAAFQPNLFERICTLMVHPRTFLAKGIRKISAAFFSSSVIRSEVSVSQRDSRFIWIRPMAIVPEMQEKGMGFALMAFICQRTRHLGYDGIKLQVDRGNRQAISYYKKAGFITTAQSHYYSTVTKYL